MKENKIKSRIRILSLRHLICPVIFLVFIIVVISSFPIKEYFIPVKVDSPDQIKTAFMDGVRHVNISTDTLYYTGYDYLRNNKKSGSFYYSIENDRCIYYLISSSFLNNTTPDVLYNVKFKAKLIVGNQVYTKLLDNFANDLSWTSTGLSNVSSKIVVSELDYSDIKNPLFILCLFCLFLYSIFDILFLIINVAVPESYYSFFKLIKHGNVHKILDLADDEINNHTIIKTKDMYLTENYFIDLGFNSVNVVPIDKIAWIYDHNRLHKFLFIKFKITSNLYLTDDYKHTFVCIGKRKDDVDLIMDRLTSDHPEILVGYSKENEHQLQNSLLGIKHTFMKLFGKSDESDDIDI